MNFRTRCVHEGVHKDQQHNSVITPIYPSSTFYWDSLETNSGYDYTRSGNPTRDALQENLASLEGGVGCVATSTGMSAVHCATALVFFSFAVERSEKETLNRVEHFGVQSLLPLFGSSESAAPAGSSLPQFDADALADQVGQLQNMWTKVLSEHTEQLSSVLNQEVHRTLKLHRMDTEDTRASYAGSLEESANQIVAQTDRLLTSFTERVDSWQNAIQTSSQASAAQSESLHELGRVLLRLTESEERLAQMQELLNSNLQSIQLTHTLEESANSLTAAVHVLSAKTNTRRAA